MAKRRDGDASSPEDLALRLAVGRACAQGVRRRRAGVGDAARRARHHQGSRRRHALLSQELPDLLPERPHVDSGHVPVISAMGNLPILKDLVVDMGPFWQKIRAMKPWLQPGYDEVAEKERIVSQQQMNVIHKEALCIMCGCCVSECNSMESDPEFLGPAALAKGFRFVGDARDQATIGRLESYNSEHGIWDCTRCYFCNERCPKGVDPRDAIAKLG